MPSGRHKHRSPVVGQGSSRTTNSRDLLCPRCHGQAASGSAEPRHTGSSKKRRNSGGSIDQQPVPWRRAFLALLSPCWQRQALAALLFHSLSYFDPRGEALLSLETPSPPVPIAPDRPTHFLPVQPPSPPFDLPSSPYGPPYSVSCMPAVALNPRRQAHPWAANGLAAVGSGPQLLCAPPVLVNGRVPVAFPACSILLSFILHLQPHAL